MNEDVVDRALRAIDQRDHDSVEGLRSAIRPEHLDAILDSWRASLPWDAKDLFVALLMDQTSARIELVMRDALASPTVETRAYSVCYLLGSLSHFEQLLSGGGWVDPTKVDQAIARWRSTTGTPDAPPTCDDCGAPRAPGGAACGFCGRPFVAPSALASDVRFVLGRHWKIRVGQGKDGDTVIARETNVIPPGPVAMKIVAIEGEFGIDALLVRLFFTTRGEPELLTASTSRVKPESNVLEKTWSIQKRGDFEIQVLDATARHLLAQVKFRIVG